MGSGSSSGFCHSSNKPESDADSFEMDLRVRELEERSSNLESLLREAEGQVAQMKKEVAARDKKIDSLIREVHKLKVSNFNQLFFLCRNFGCPSLGILERVKCQK
ncbi:hypothetical protein TNCV_4680591 [Trichonephila clavipes]|nr:hypothetical protein TNCV_4680591 [Trichonephila clavipes]